MPTISRKRNHSWGNITVSCSTEINEGQYIGSIEIESNRDESSLDEVWIDTDELQGITVTKEKSADFRIHFQTTIDADATDVPSNQSIQVHLIFINGVEESIPISLLSAFPLSCLHKILTEQHSKKLTERIHDRYGESREKRSLFAFMQDSEPLLSFEDTVEMMNVFSKYNNGYQREMSRTSHAFFKNVLFGKKQYSANSQSEFENMVEIFSSKQHLCDIDQKQVEKLYVSEWRSWDGSPPTEPEDFGFTRKAAKADIDSPQFIEWAAEAVLDENIELVRDRLRPDERQLTSDKYEELKERAQEARPTVRADKWTEIVTDASMMDRPEFEFVLGNFLYWQGISQRDNKFNQLDTVYGAAALLFYRTNVPILQQKANCQQKITLANNSRIDGEYTDALVHARKALEIAINEQGRWETALENLAARARRDYALLQRNHLLSQDEFDGALTVLRNTRDEILSTDIPERFKTSLLDHLDANRYATAAQRAENKGELLEAKQYFEQSYHYFDQCNRKQRKSFINDQLEQVIDRIQDEEYREAYREKDLRQSQPGEEESSRDPSFREKVIEAYDGTCAFCGACRKTPDGRFEAHAAHIHPVSDGGPDLVQNGLALCRLHHWAFDNGWLAINDNYRLLIADRTETTGYKEFLELEQRKIRPPENEYQQPGSDFIKHHREQHGFEETTTQEEYPDDLTEEELADTTSTDMEETVEQNVEAASKTKNIFSKEDVVGSKNDLIGGESL